MELSWRECWAILHGMILGGFFLGAFGGGLAGFWSLRPEWVTSAGVTECIRRMVIGTTTMAIVAWLTVLLGTYVIYPWYRARPPVEPAKMTAAELQAYPKFYLPQGPHAAQTAAWHDFAMEWKEHVAWLVPILATAVAFVVARYRAQLVNERNLRRALIVLFTIAFLAAATAGGLGALINKAAAVR